MLVGEVGNKRATPVFKRNQDDGSFLVDDKGKLILDADFGDSLSDLRNSRAVDVFPWLAKGASSDGSGWSVSIQRILRDRDLTMDPKRHCQKVVELRKSIRGKDHVRLGDIVDFVQEKRSSKGYAVTAVPSNSYKYVELQDIGYGDFRFADLRGWQLPSRARHFAEVDDIYMGAIWGSVAKWFYTPDGAVDVVVTNGCHRMRIKAGKESRLSDLLAFMSTEAYAVQMRSRARGSDGLAEITQDDASEILIPVLDSAERSTVSSLVDDIKSGDLNFRSRIQGLVTSKSIDLPIIAPRQSHVILV